MKSLKSPEVLLSEEAIAKRVREMGETIRAEYQQHELTVVCVLEGSFIFMADLVRAIDLPLKCDFLGLSSYGSATESSGVVQITKDLGDPVENRDVLVIEDIIDTGLTLNYLIRYLRGKNPASLRICTLLDKPARRLVDIPVDYIGFQIPDQFVATTVTESPVSQLDALVGEILSRERLAPLVEKHKLYPELREKVPMIGLVAIARANVVVGSADSFVPKKRGTPASVINISFRDRSPRVAASK